MFVVRSTRPSLGAAFELASCVHGLASRYRVALPGAARPERSGLQEPMMNAGASCPTGPAPFGAAALEPGSCGSMVTSEHGHRLSLEPWSLMPRFPAAAPQSEPRGRAAPPLACPGLLGSRSPRLRQAGRRPKPSRVSAARPPVNNAVEHNPVGPRQRSSQVDDDDPALRILVRVRFHGRSVDVQRKLEARLLCVRFSPLGFFASANLLDDERG